MHTHPALTAGRAAVITGGASGIGLAAAKRFASLGMKICLADLSQDALDRAAAEMPGATVMTVPTDVSKMDEVLRLKERAYAAFGEVAVLMNNAGTAPGGGPWDHYRALAARARRQSVGRRQRRARLLPGDDRPETPGAIVNTGSKQGITCPPGDTAYNVSKAGVKVLTEGLAHALRNVAGCRVTAHLLVPGSTFTGMTARGRDREAARRLDAGAGRRLHARSDGDGRFLHHLPRQRRDPRHRQPRESCGRPRTSSDNRPALSRWHPDYKDEFAAFMKTSREEENHSAVVMLIVFRSITAQFGVTFYLRRLQQRDSRQVISEMGVAQLGLGDADLGRGGGQGVGRYLVVCEQLVQGGLLGNQALSDRDRFCLHGFEQASHGAALGIGKAELVGQLEQVAGARIAVQFGDQRQTHAASGFQVGDLLFGERLDRPSFHAGIRRLRGGGTYGEDGGCEKKERLAVHGRPQRTVGSGLQRRAVHVRLSATFPREPGLSSASDRGRLPVGTFGRSILA